ncbi:hypothetical protein PO79_04685, partial [Vibrio parahaemolyticus]
GLSILTLFPPITSKSILSLNVCTYTKALFEDIFQQINARRDELFVRADEFVFNDYGAGARDENRSPEMMDIGVKCTKTLKDFAYIGVKN